MLDEYRARRDQLCRWLARRAAAALRHAGRRVLPVPRRLGLPVARRAAHLRRTSRSRCSTDAHVAVTPGEAFDAPGFLRLSYATSLDRAAERGTRTMSIARRSQTVSRRRRAVAELSRPCSPPAFLAQLEDAVGRRARPRPTPAAPADLRHRRAEAGPSGRRRRLPGIDRGSRRDRAALRRGTRAARAARRRHAATPAASVPVRRRRRPRARADEPHPRDRRGEPARGRRAQRHHRRPAGRGRARRPVLSAGPVSRCGSRRSAATSPSAPAGRARSSTARPSATCSGSRRCCRPARSSETGGKIGEERRRLRPHAAAGGIGRHAGDHHEDHPAAGAEAAGRRRRFARLLRATSHGAVQAVTD